MKKTLLFSMALISGLAAYGQQCGRSTNAFSILRGAQNQVIANSDLNTIVFIHRLDVNLTGDPATNNGKLMYSLSTDGGTTWTENVGPLNTTYTRRARYPQVSLFNPAGNTDPLASHLVWAAPVLWTGPVGWDGHVNGAAPLSTVAPTSTENYNFIGTNTGLQGGLCERVAGEYWLAEVALINDTANSDTIVIYKGLWNNGTQNVEWSKAASVHFPLSTSFDGTGRLTSTNIAFSPDGQTGYVASLGDLAGGTDSTYHPILMKTTDGGATWGAPYEVDVTTIPGLLDSAQTISFDDGTQIVTASEVTTAFDFDITVDANGNPHIFSVICVAESKNEVDVAVGTNSYVVYSGYPKFAWDITSDDGGSTWKGIFVSPVLSFRTQLPISVGSAATSVDNQPQIGRTADGNIIFYSWSDTDSLLTGFTTDNIAPNLRVAGYRISDGFQTCWKRIEGVANEDDVIAPTMSPIVLENAAGTQFNVPVVSMDILTNVDGPVQYHYMGNLANFCSEDFMNPAGMDFSWTIDGLCYLKASCASVGLNEENTVTFSVYPNPASTSINVKLDVPADEISYISISNMLGQNVKTISPSSLNGAASISVEDLANGVYNMTVLTSGKSYTSKFTVSK